MGKARCRCWRALRTDTRTSSSGAVGDDGNLFLAEALHRVQNEDFAVSASGIAQRQLHQRDQFLPRSHLFRIAGMAIGNRVLFQQSVVRLVKLQACLVAGLRRFAFRAGAPAAHRRLRDRVAATRSMASLARR